MKTIELNLRNYLKKLKKTEDEFMKPLGMKFPTLLQALNYCRKKPDFELYYKLKNSYPDIDIQAIIAESSPKKPRQKAKATTGKFRTYIDNTGAQVTLAPFTKELDNQYKKMIGKNIEAIRTKKNITTHDVAMHMDMWPSNISQLENGKIAISTPKLIHLCRVLDVDFEEILISPEAKNPKENSSLLLKQIDGLNALLIQKNETIARNEEQISLLKKNIALMEKLLGNNKK